MRLSSVFAAIACALLLSCCGDETRGDPQLSPVSPVLAAEGAMRVFAQMIGELTPQQRERLVSVQQLHALMGGDECFDDYRSATWSHTEWETVGRPRFDYHIYPNPMAVPKDDAILLATPNEIRISYGVFSRVALTHSLKTIRIGDEEFHRMILRQTGRLNP